MVLIAMKTDTKGLTRLNVRAIRIPQAKGRTHYAFPLSARTAHDLIESGLLRIDIWSASNEDGYQRSPSASISTQLVPSMSLMDSTGFSALPKPLKRIQMP